MGSAAVSILLLLLPLLWLQARADFAAASDRLQETEVKLMNAQADAKAVGAQLEAAQREQVQLMACVEQREKVRRTRAVTVCGAKVWQMPFPPASKMRTSQGPCQSCMHTAHSMLALHHLA
jgi:hypothetical protein